MARIRALVDGPLLSPPRYGLIVSARLPEGDDPHWVQGLTYRPDTCDFITTTEFCASGDGDPDEKVRQDHEEAIDHFPVGIVAGTRCTGMGSVNEDDVARVTRVLNANASYAIERELWTGEAHDAEYGDDNRVNARLADPEATDDLGNGSALSVVDSLACLEQGIAECGHGQQGMIHATVQTVTLWNERGFLRREGQRLFTALDTIVVPGSGYPGTDPDGAVGPGNVWAYGTQVVDVRRGDVQGLGGIGSPGNRSSVGFDRATNDVIAYAEQLTAATFGPCCHVGVQINITPCGAGAS